MTYYISYRTRLKDPIDKYQLIIKDDTNSSVDLMLLCRQIIRCGYRKISKKKQKNYFLSIQPFKSSKGK